MWFVGISGLQNLKDFDSAQEYQFLTCSEKSEVAKQLLHSKECSLFF